MRMSVIAENVFFPKRFFLCVLVNVNYRTISRYRAGIQVSAFCAPIMDVDVFGTLRRNKKMKSTRRAKSRKLLRLATVISVSGKITFISALNYITCKLYKLKLFIPVGLL